MKAVKLRDALHYRGKWYGAGFILDLDEDAAAALVSQGLALPHERRKKAKDKAKKAPAKEDPDDPPSAD